MYTTTRFITSSYSEWLLRIKHKLDSEHDTAAIAELKAFFDPKKHQIHVHIIAKYKNFYTKAKDISSHTHDCSNFEKAILDIFCDRKHFDIANDKYVTRLLSEKQEATAYDSFEVHMEILDR